MSLEMQSLDTKRSAGRDGSLLSPVAYDDDAVSLHSRSDQDTDSEDDQLVARARNSRELRARDRMVLMEEEEMDKLVTDTRAKQDRSRRGSGLAIPNPLTILRSSSQNRSDSAIDVRSKSSVEDLRGEKRKQRRSRRQGKRDRLLREARDGEDRGLMYEMESGGMRDGSSTGSSDREDSDELDRQNLKMHSDSKAEKGQRWRKWLFIYAIVLVGFAFLVLLAWKLSVDKKRQSASALLSNGTALFGPTTIIVSLDGFRADFLQRGLTPRLNEFVKEGVSPLYMLPSFPSVTFPNHYTIATGLYPESHGVVGNTFWDPAIKAEFFYTDPARSMDPKWWGGEPFWVTAERQGVRTAIHMWPGSEAHIGDFEPSFLDPYNGKEELSNKVDRVLGLLDLAGAEDRTTDATDTRPQLIAAYVPNVDADGHKYGPNSTEIRSTIESVDTMLDQLFHGLEVRNLSSIVNVIVVSDHGMATTDVSRMIQLDDLVDMSKVEHLDGWPLMGIRPKDPSELRELYDKAAEKAKSNPNFDVYLRDENMPERYHFSRNDRIAPLWIVPKTGWAIVPKDEFDVADAKAKGTVYHPRGLHGYDHEHPLMRAIFVARGPAFPHTPNSKVEPFQNTEIYNILCDSVGMEPLSNNGTLRLPLKTVGLHDGDASLPQPEDPVPTATLAEAEPSTAMPSSTSTVKVDPVDTEKEPAPTDGAKDDDGNDGDDDDDHKDDGDDQHRGPLKSAWDWLTGKLDDLWNKLTGST